VQCQLGKMGTNKMKRSKAMPTQQVWHITLEQGVLRKREVQHLFTTKNGWYVNKDKGVIRKIKVSHMCHANKEKGVLRKRRGQNYVNFARVTRHLRAGPTKENRSSTTMPDKKGWDVNKDKGVLRKLKFWLLFQVNKEKGVLGKQRGQNLCQPSKCDMSPKRNGY